MKEKINHPSHYQTVPGIECIQVVQHFNFNLGNAIKYIWRAGHKDGATYTEDLKKAIRYLEYEIERMEEETAPVQNPEPEWEEAPTWAKWWAIDVHGSAFWYDKEPLRGVNSTIWTPNGTNYLVARAGDYEEGNYDWTRSKRKRVE